MKYHICYFYYLCIIPHLFSNTYVEVQEKADVIWKFKRYHLVKDYKDRSFLPPPFTVLLVPYIYSCWQCLLRKRANSIIGKFVGNKAKGRISKRVFQESKARQNVRKTSISYPLIRTRT